MKISRRYFLGGLGVASAGLLTYRYLEDKRPLSHWDLSSYPVKEVDGLSRSFGGDQFETPHRGLWEKEKFLKSMGGAPFFYESTDLVIVGAGVSGLAAAYELRAKNPIILDQAPQFGGNSKGESRQGLLFSTGAAYINTPEEGSESFKLLSDLNILNKGRPDEGEGQLLSDGKVEKNFWRRHGKAFIQLKKIFENSYPGVPFEESNGMPKSQFDEMDRMRFSDWAKKNFSMKPELEKFLRLYCMSSFGGDWSELSTAQALSFLTADLNAITVFPGGNSFITQSICQALTQNLSTDRLRSSSLVLDIRVNEHDVDILYFYHGNLRRIKAKSCIFSGAKFLAKRIVSSLDDAQREAMNRIKYRAYIVINLILRKNIKSDSYDLFNIDFMNQGAQEIPRFTDIIFAQWASSEKKQDADCLTFYIPVPHDQGRALLLSPSSYDLVRKSFESELPGLAKQFNFSLSDIEDIRLIRWGHPLPLAEPGFIADGLAERASQSIGGRLFFANQDRWLNPCFETAVTSAYAAISELRNAS